MGAGGQLPPLSFWQNRRRHRQRLRAQLLLVLLLAPPVLRSPLNKDLNIKDNVFLWAYLIYFNRIFPAPHFRRHNWQFFFYGIHITFKLWILASVSCWFISTWIHWIWAWFLYLEYVGCKEKFFLLVTKISDIISDINNQFVTPIYLSNPWIFFSQIWVFFVFCLIEKNFTESL